MLFGTLVLAQVPAGAPWATHLQALVVLAAALGGALAALYARDPEVWAPAPAALSRPKVKISPHSLVTCVVKA